MFDKIANHIIIFCLNAFFALSSSNSFVSKGLRVDSAFLISVSSSSSVENPVLLFNYVN